MRIDPELARLRVDPARVDAAAREAECAVARWRANPTTVTILDDLARHGDGAPIEACPALLALITDGDVAPVRALLRELVVVMARAPLAQPRLAGSSKDTAHRITLAGSGVSALSLSLVAVTPPTASAPARRAMFRPGTLHLRVLAGRARARLLERSDAAIISRSLALEAGHARTLDLMQQCLELDRVDAPLVTLRLSSQPDTTEPVRELDIATGALLRQTASDPRESRIELAMALLGRMDRHDAAPLFAQIARSGSASLRWQALRECLALDTRTGFAALLEVATDPADALHTAARALAEQLAAQHPALAAMREDVLCPA